MNQRTSAAFAFVILVPISHACRSSEETPPCAGIQSTLDAVRGLSRLDWRELDEATLESVWPISRDLRPFCKNCSTDEGFRAVLNCCQSCEICPSLAFDRPNEARTLMAVSVATCPKVIDEAFRDRNMVIEAMEPAETVTHEFSVEDVRVQSFAWERDGYQRALDASIGLQDGQWVAYVTLWQCTLEPAVRDLPGPDGKRLRATHIEVDSSDSSSAELHIEYDTDCDPRDRRCIEAETQAMLPTVRDMAETGGCFGDCSLGRTLCNEHVSFLPKKRERHLAPRLS